MHDASPDLVVTKREAAEPLTWLESKMPREVKQYDMNNAAEFMHKDKSKYKANGGAFWTHEEHDRALMGVSKAGFESRERVVCCI